MKKRVRTKSESEYPVHTAPSGMLPPDPPADPPSEHYVWGCRRTTIPSLDEIEGTDEDG